MLLKKHTLMDTRRETFEPFQKANVTRLEIMRQPRTAVNDKEMEEAEEDVLKVALIPPDCRMPVRLVEFLVELRGGEGEGEGEEKLPLKMETTGGEG